MGSKGDKHPSSRVRRAVAINRSRLQPDFPVQGESETDMEEFVPYDIPDEREMSRSPMNKQVAVDDYDNGDVDGLEYPSDELFRNFRNSQASGSGTDQTDLPEFGNLPPDLDSFFDFRMPSTVGDSVELKASRMCHGVRFPPCDRDSEGESHGGTHDLV
ncbi:hypothetical protein YC2023_059314 [Brassica napus]